jgi:branched-chain amino acid transport system permease protein
VGVSLSQLVAFALVGVGSGALISGIGLGVVLSYRGSGVVNLAAGAIAMLSGYCYWALRVGQFGVSFAAGWAVLFTVLFALVVGIGFELGVVRPLRRQTPLAKLVATLGILVSAPAAIVLAFGQYAKPQPAILPTGNVTLYGVIIPENHIWMALVLLALSLVFAAAYRWTRFGIGSRAASENEGFAMLLGVAPNRYSMLNTVFMSLTMALVGLLSASIAEVDPSTLPLLIVPGLAAAMFGRLTGFVSTYVAGIVIGMAESVLLYLSTQSWFPTSAGGPLPGVQEVLVFLALVIATFFRAGKIPSRGAIVERHLPRAPRPVAPLRSAATWVPVAAVAMWALPFGFREGLITSCIAAISLLSLVVITGYVGQLSLVQLALAGAAGFTVSHLFTNFGIGFPWAPLVAIVAATLLGVLTGFPALRVRGVNLVVVTLAAAVAIEAFWFGNATWGGGVTGSYVPAPSLFGWNFGSNASFHGLGGGEPSPLFGWFVLLVTVVVALLVANLRRSSLGQEMLAVRANERAAAASGVNVRNVKLIGFAIAAATAGVSGVLLAYSYGSITSASYDTTIALALVAFVYISGITSVPGGIFGGIIYTGGLFAYALLDWFGIQGNWLNLAVGILVILSLVGKPEGGATFLFYGLRGARRQPPPGTRDGGQATTNLEVGALSAPNVAVKVAPQRSELPQ